MATKKIPLRKCIGCQEMKNKKELIRVVRNDAGEISLDSTGKKPGRGAYVCPTRRVNLRDLIGHSKPLFPRAFMKS